MPCGVARSKNHLRQTLVLDLGPYANVEARAEIYIPQAQPYENLIKNEQTRDFRKSSTTDIVCFVCFVVNFCPFLD